MSTDSYHEAKVKLRELSRELVTMLNSISPEDMYTDTTRNRYEQVRQYEFAVRIALHAIDVIRPGHFPPGMSTYASGILEIVDRDITGYRFGYQDGESVVLEEVRRELSRRQVTERRPSGPHTPLDPHAFVKAVKRHSYPPPTSLGMWDRCYSLRHASWKSTWAALKAPLCHGCKIILGLTNEPVTSRHP